MSTFSIAAQLYNNKAIAFTSGMESEESNDAVSEYFVCKTDGKETDGEFRAVLYKFIK